MATTKLPPDRSGDGDDEYITDYYKNKRGEIKSQNRGPAPKYYPDPTPRTLWPEGTDPVYPDKPTESFADWAKQYSGDFGSDKMTAIEVLEAKRKAELMAKKFDYEKKWQDKSKPKKSNTRKHMANKFLPFIVESSSPLNIFETILARSKGMTNLKVASVFSVVINNDIKKLREYIKKLPEMPMDKMYDELVTRHSQYSVDEWTMKIFVALGKYVKSENQLWEPELDEFEPNDRAAFFAAMAFKKVAQPDMDIYTVLPYEDIFKEAENVLSRINDYVKFSSSGVSTVFTDRIDLEAFILYRALLRENIPGKHDPSELKPIRVMMKVIPKRPSKEDPIPEGAGDTPSPKGEWSEGGKVPEDHSDSTPDDGDK